MTAEHARAYNSLQATCKVTIVLALVNRLMLMHLHRSQMTEEHAFAALKKVKGQLFINNQWVDAKQGGKLDVIDPRNGKTIKQVFVA